jgi:hypothetical protein
MGFGVIGVQPSGSSAGERVTIVFHYLLPRTVNHDTVTNACLMNSSRPVFLFSFTDVLTQRPLVTVTLHILLRTA